jgi:hypothetical protein
VFRPTARYHRQPRKRRRVSRANGAAAAAAPPQRPYAAQAASAARTAAHGPRGRRPTAHQPPGREEGRAARAALVDEHLRLHLQHPLPAPRPAPPAPRCSARLRLPRCCGAATDRAHVRVAPNAACRAGRRAVRASDELEHAPPVRVVALAVACTAPHRASRHARRRRKRAACATQHTRFRDGRASRAARLSQTTAVAGDRATAYSSSPGVKEKRGRQGAGPQRGEERREKSEAGGGLNARLQACLCLPQVREGGYREARPCGP